MQFPTLSVLIVLSLAVIKAAEQDTLLCYGNDFKKIIGLSKEDTTINLHCSRCTNRHKLCSSDHLGEVCIWLSDDEVHFFDNNGGVLQDPLPLSDCTPISIQNAGGGFVVKCASSSPDYQPTRQYISDREYADVFELGPLLTLRTGRTYASVPNNHVLVYVDFNEYIISFVPDSNKVVIEYGSTPYEKTILGCSTIHGVTDGPTDEGNIQVVVTCDSAEGGQARKRVSILEYNLQAEPVIDSLYDPLPNDVVWFEGAYIVYRGSTRVVIIRTSAITADPAIIEAKNGAKIDGVSFLSDSQLLLSVNEQPFEVLDIPMYFSSSFENGRTVLANSEAYCPEGHCTPHRGSEETLYLFSKDSSSYLVLMSYDLNDLSVDSTRISRSVIEDEFDVCFKTMADIPVIETDPPSDTTTPTDAPDTPPLTTPDTTTTEAETPPVGGLQQPSQKPALPDPAIAGIVVGVILASALILTVVIVVILCAVCKSTSCRAKAKLLCKQRSHNLTPRITQAQDTEQGCDNLHVYVTSFLGHGQTQPTLGGSHGSSSTPSSAPSLTKLDNIDQPSDKSVNVTAHQESVFKHADLRPGVATTSMVANS